MIALANLLGQFAACALLIGFGGYALSSSGDRLAESHGWGRSWVGLALLATVTSLPELASGIGAVVVVGAPDLAVGHVLGACVLNLVLLVLVDAAQRAPAMYHHASGTHLLSAAFGVVMLGFVATNLLVARQVPAAGLHLALYGPALLGLYLLALASVHGHERAARASAPAAATRVIDRRREWRRFAIAGVTVAAAGTWLPGVADALALEFGLSQSFVGTLFMAVATSLPELAVSIAALRIGALDLAIANLLGSNLFNTTILVVDDLLYTRGSLLADAQAVHAGTAVTAMVMTGLVIVGLVMRPQGRVLRTGSWVSVGLLGAYLLNAVLVWLHGTG